MITVNVKGQPKRANKFLEKLLEKVQLGSLDKYGRMGVEALSASTPVYTGLAAKSWYYTIDREVKGRVSITWHNSDIEGGYSVVLLVQYGHGTKGGTYVQGVDFINPAMKPVFDKIAEDLYKEVM